MEIKGHTFPTPHADRPGMSWTRDQSQNSPTCCDCKNVCRTQTAQSLVPLCWFLRILSGEAFDGGDG